MTAGKETLLSDVARLIREALQLHSRRLEGVGLSSRVGPVRVDNGDYEFYVDFSDENGIADVIEFHVIRGHMQVATLTEIERWLEDSIADVVRRAEDKMRRSSSKN